MNVATMEEGCHPGNRRSWAGLLLLACTMGGAVYAQDASAKAQDATGATKSTPQTTAPSQTPANPGGEATGGEEPAAGPLPSNSTPEQRVAAAWTLLENALGETKRPDTRTQALAALSMLRSPRAEAMITSAFKDSDVDVRTAAVLAAGETKYRNLTTPLRNLLDDNDPQVVFAAAMTLWKMGDKSGEYILMSVADGDRSPNPSMARGTKEKISHDLHEPSKLAKLGATQGAYMLLGPFGYGLTAFNFIHQSGGNTARAEAIEQIAQERTEPIHKELMAALGDKDPVVRAAAAKGLLDYRDQATSMAICQLFADSKQPVRLTAAAAYLRTTGVPGPSLTATAAKPPAAKR